MGFFRNLFGAPDPVDVSLVAAPPLEARQPKVVGYDAKLVDTLLAQHAQLGALFDRIGRSAQNHDYAKVRTLLVRFKTSLQGHILTENVRFYAYLENTFSGDADNSRTMHEFRREMNSIARQVTDFVSAWQDNDFATPLKREQFAAEYLAVGKLLEQRLDNEESNLYPLYG